MAPKHAATRVIARGPDRPRATLVRLIATLAAFALLAGVGGVLAGGMAVPLAGALSAGIDEALKLFDEIPTEIGVGRLSQRSEVYAADGSLLAVFYAQNRIVVPLRDISEHMQHAVIAIEDERFPTHAGVDLHSMARAAVNNLTGGPQQGASTLTQQYVKNLLIAEADRAENPFGIVEARADSLARKVKEMRLAIALERELSKSEILGGYLNIAQFGANNIYGVESAARYFFNKSAKDLTPVEAATIAGVTKAPSTFDPVRDPELAEQRRNAVLFKMYSLGYLSPEEYHAARQIPLADTLHLTPVPTGCASAAGAAFFCNYVIQVMKNAEEFGETVEERMDLLYRGGLKIITTLDPRLQAAAEAALAEVVPHPNSADLDAVLVTVQPGTGRILAMAQNVPFDGSDRPLPGTTAQNYAAGPLYGSSKGFQIGSSFKTFVLAQWLLEGHTLNEYVNGSVRERPLSDFWGSCVGPFSRDQRWRPSNVLASMGGSMSVYRATIDSVNAAYVDMESQLDLCGVADTAWSMGFRPTQVIRDQAVVTLYRPTRDDVEIVPSMVLGAQTTSPLALASAYATLAAGGTHCEPIAIVSVFDADGLRLSPPSARCNSEALPPEVAATVTHALQKVLSDGAARSSRLPDGRDQAGKTGTTNRASQTWFTGYTPNLVTTAWVGDASGEVSHLDVMFEGRRLRPLYASTLAAPLWGAYMTVAVQGLEPLEFPPPDQKLVGRPPAPPATAPEASAPEATAPEASTPEASTPEGGATD
ncbi:MAG: penicillin-binding protein [Promicromonosporaceae bacterium]|nr:penicillin-binding protein [Promicromonosporaceae bacterium]